jgi:hypothetical protein
MKFNHEKNFTATFHCQLVFNAAVILSRDQNTTIVTWKKKKYIMYTCSNSALHVAAVIGAATAALMHTAWLRGAVLASVPRATNEEATPYAHWRSVMHAHIIAMQQSSGLQRIFLQCARATSPQRARGLCVRARALQQTFLPSMETRQHDSTLQRILGLGGDWIIATTIDTGQQQV